MLIDVSCGETTVAGRFLGKIYYESPVLGLFTREECSGSPHNGGQHILVLNARKADIESFLKLLNERYDRRKGCQEFIAHIRSKMRWRI